MKNIITTILLFSACLCNAQIKSDDISFNKKEHDFGLFPELGGPVSYAFIITNTGDKPLIIYEAKPSCSCTVSEWDKSPVLPGASTVIETSYDPKGRPGVFSKSIQLRTNLRPEPYVLVITGKVEPRAKTLEEQYPINVGLVRLSTNKIDLGTISSTHTLQATIELLNTSNKKLDIKFENTQAHMQASCTPNTLAPGEKGIITVEYNAQAKQDWGWCYDIIHYTIAGKSDSKYSIRVKANIVDKATDWTEEERKNAPVLNVDNVTYLFEDTRANDKVTCPFIITNTGKRDLIIYKVKHACSCTSSGETTLRIAPNESITLPIIFDTKNTKGMQRKTITLYTNAIESTTKIMIQGHVLSEDN